MKVIFKVLLILPLLGLSNCSDLKKGLGIEKDVPDEFIVRKTKPIERPPNYDLLPPDTKDKEIKSTQSFNENSNLKSIIDNSLNKNLQKSKKNKTKVESQSDLENTILKELSK